MIYITAFNVLEITFIRHRLIATKLSSRMYEDVILMLENNINLGQT